MNMFTENVKPRETGPAARPNPAGCGGEGAPVWHRDPADRRSRLRGHDAPGYRAGRGVSVGLLYRYFPSKQAIVIALYDELSAALRAPGVGPAAGTWRERFIFALTTSLEVLEPHELALRALTPVLVGDPEEGIFAASTAFSRLRVQRVFEQAVTGASDAPKAAVG